jgi:hypothetical protein
MDFWKNEEIVHFCADKLTFYGYNLRTPMMISSRILAQCLQFADKNACDPQTKWIDF